MNEKFNSIDLFKFLMAIVVVIFHTNPFVDCRNNLINGIVIIIADASVPFFFMASGYFLALKWGDTSTQHETYIHKSLVSTIQLYTTWTLFSLPLTIYGYGMSGNSIISCIFSYVKYFLFVGKLYNSYHLWYLLAMIYALLVMRLLIHNGKGTRHFLIAGIFLYAMYLLFAWVREGGGENGMWTVMGNVFYFVFNNGEVFVGMLFMSIGVYIREHQRVSTMVSVAGIAAGILIRYSLSQELGNILTAVMLFTLVLDMKLPDRPCYLFLRGLSKYIYLLHLLCFSFYTIIIIDQPNKLGIDSFWATFILSAVISAAIIYWKGAPGKGIKKMIGNWAIVRRLQGTTRDSWG